MTMHPNNDQSSPMGIELLRPPRYDYFLIWGHGVPCRNRIVEMIRNNKSLKIVKILLHTPETVERLVEVIYSYDYAPIDHLKAKTEYLKQTPNQVCFIFVENHFPDEDYFGGGPYRHIESKTIKGLKEKIRDSFNPRICGKRSEEHVIHASDNQMQTDYILKYLKYDGIDLFKNNNLALNMPYHIREVSCFSIKKIPVSSLFCRMVVDNGLLSFPKLISLDKTPHCVALSGDYQAYEDYINRFMGQSLTDDHTLQGLLRLKDNFRYLEDPFESNYIVVEEIGDGKYSIVDGLHRSAILKYRGVPDVNVAII